MSVVLCLLHFINFNYGVVRFHSAQSECFMENRIIIPLELFVLPEKTSNNQQQTGGKERTKRGATNPWDPILFWWARHTLLLQLMPHSSLTLYFSRLLALLVHCKLKSFVCCALPFHFICPILHYLHSSLRLANHLYSSWMWWPKTRCS